MIRPMSRPELDVLVDWAAAEGWNPGLADAEVFWETDPDGFVAVEEDGALVAGGSIVSYGGRFGFMGFFIVAPGHRGRGLGRRLWAHRRDALTAPRQTASSKVSWSARTANSVYLSSMTQETAISEVEIMWMLTPSRERARNIRAATPEWLRIPTPTMETLAIRSS